jgi:LacI family gluconate utilization system Gnt-I transcriptional repressor
MGPRLRLPDRKSKVTVKEVAQRAGVGESTVSRIMRNKGPVAEKRAKGHGGGSRHRLCT